MLKLVHRVLVAYLIGLIRHHDEVFLVELLAFGDICAVICGREKVPLMLLKDVCFGCDRGGRNTDLVQTSGVIELFFDEYLVVFI